MRPPLVALVLAVLVVSPAVAEPVELGDPVVLRGAAVAETPRGLVGSIATFTIRAAPDGSGHIFLDTFPLTQVDMQGSARLAARVAAQVTGRSLAEHDLFFVIRSGSTQIGGPSAGATLTVGAIAALEGWTVRSDVLMTGTINPDGSIGPVGGVAEKAKAAADAGLRRFLFPAGEESVPLASEGGRLVDLPAYCASQLGIECLPVSDVYEAVENMTDHAFVRAPVVGNVTGDAFRARLGPLSEELVGEATRLLGEAQAAVGRVPPGSARSSLEEAVALASRTLERAESASANGTYYTAASLSFQSSIGSHDARDRARLVLAEDPFAVLEVVLGEAEAAVGEAREAVEGSRVSHAALVETVGAAQVRLLEAEERLARARAAAATGATTDVARAVYEAAYASERARTATWWLGLGEGSPLGEEVAVGALENAARDAITTTSEEIAYVEAVLESAGAVGALGTARERLAAAQEAIERRFYAAAMLTALEAQVRASDILVVATFGGRVPEAKMESTRLAAARAIQEARGRGVEPILAESQYEFGLTLEDDLEKLSFLGLARTTANLAGLPGVFGATGTGTPSRFQGVPDAVGVEPRWLPAVFAVGLALGVGLGLTAMMEGRAARRREEEELRAFREGLR